MGILNNVFNYNEPDSYVNRLRKKRFNDFLGLLNQLRNPCVIRILDVGGTYGYWRSMGFLDPERYHITLVNLHAIRLPETAAGFSSCIADIRSRSFNIQDYDVVFSNSVIEHLGSKKAMQELASRITECGKPYYMQTPSKWFPLEPHSHLPFFQFIPRILRAWLIFHFRIKYFPKGKTLKECLEVSDSTILLDKRAFKALFPDSTLMTEKLFGIPKSYVVHHGFESTS